MHDNNIDIQFAYLKEGEEDIKNEMESFMYLFT